MKIIVAMSGGVDSTVAAAFLQRAGHEVAGMTIQLYGVGPGIAAAARKAADALDIPHYVLDLQDMYKKAIIDPFCAQYRMGRTPNPCVRCNELMKFGVLWEKARETGAEAMATGHYARIEYDTASGKYRLKKGMDKSKDQSYFLHRMTQEQLSHTLFPLGEMTKSDVRKIAAELGLPNASRKESQEICFIPDDDYVTFLNRYAPAPPSPGPILDKAGQTVGRHRGIWHYTIGQRKGLGIAAAEPLYVTDIDAAANTVTVGTKDMVYAGALTAGEVNWVGGKPPAFPLHIKARVRYRHQEAAAEVTPLPGANVYVKFTEPQPAVTPGQAVVFYDGDEVAGGGNILKQS